MIYDWCVVCICRRYVQRYGEVSMFFPGDVEHPPLMAGEWAHARWTSGCAYEVSAVASVSGALVLAEMQVTRIAVVDGIYDGMACQSSQLCLVPCSDDYRS
jgi:hypothetical protein